VTPEFAMLLPESGNIAVWDGMSSRVVRRRNLGRDFIGGLRWWVWMENIGSLVD